jgi:opacity protein-like surface antigen
MATGAQADELTALKAQLEALQGRVNQLEQRPATNVALPEGASFLSFNRGEGSLGDFGRMSKIKDDYDPERGFVISVTPTADVPAPVAEVVVYGYVKGDVIYDLDEHDIGDSFYIPNLWSNFEDDEGIRLHARQTRFGIRSKVDTAVGQIRTLIEGDFFSSGNVFRLRHAWGEWDFAPYWTLGVGQYWQTAALLPLGITTVDFSGDAGPQGYTRRPQVRLTYHNGPISWAVAIEQPSFQSTATWPNVSAYFQYDAAGGHQFIITGTVADWDHEEGPSPDDDFETNEFGWAVQAGANINLGDIATFTVGGAYGEREVCKYLNQTGAWCGVAVDSDKAGAVDFFVDTGWGVFAGLTFNVNDTTSINLGGGWSHLDNDFADLEDVDGVDVFSAHANILWQPVKQMRLGWEVMWGQYDWDAGDGFDDHVCDEEGCTAEQKESAIRVQFGAWFFF